MRENLSYQLFRAVNVKTGKAYPKWRIRYLEGRKYLFAETGYTDKGRTEERAKERLREIEHEEHLKAIGKMPTTKEGIETLVEMYLAVMAAKGGKNGFPASPQHVGNCRVKLAFWIKTLNLKKPSDIRLSHVDAALAKMKVSGGTLEQYAQALRSFANWCVKNRYADHNPLAGFQKPAKVPTFVRRAFTIEEITRLLAICPDKRALIYKVALVTGLRRKELDSLKISSVDWKTGRIKLPAAEAKNRKKAEFHIPENILAELYAFSAGRKVTEKLLPVVSPSKSARTLKIYLGKAGIPVETPEGILDFHSFRVTFLTFVNELGEDVKTVQELARHANPDLTFGVYVKKKEDRMRKVIESIGLAIPETNPGIPRLGMDNRGITSQMAMTGTPIESRVPAKEPLALCAPGLTPEISSQPPVESELEAAKGHALGFFMDAANTGVSGHSQTQDVSHLHNNLVSQISYILARLPTADLQSLLEAVKTLQQGRGVA